MTKLAETFHPEYECAVSAKWTKSVGDLENVQRKISQSGQRVDYFSRKTFQPVKLPIAG